MMGSVVNKTTPITHKVQQTIAELHGTKKAKDLADMFGVTVNQVYDIGIKFNVANKLNQVFDISGLQEQMILSGILGDGILKKNGRYNYYYSEYHGIGDD